MLALASQVHGSDMTNTATVKTNSNLAETLSRLNSYGIGAALLSYLIGFLITNLYLGSLGIVNFDLLRARYVLAGLLFLFFLGAPAFLVYGLTQTLRRNQEKTPWVIISRAASYSLQSGVLLYLVIRVIAALAGSTSSPPIGIPRLSPAVPWSEWFAQSPLLILKQSTTLYSILMLSIILVVAVVIAINPKDKAGIRKPRRRILAEMFSTTKREAVQAALVLLGLFVFLYGWLLASSVLAFFVSNKAVGVSATPASLPPNGWVRYYVGIIVLYVPVAIFLLFPFISPPATEDKEDQDDPVARRQAWIFFIALVITFSVPAYAIGIYPGLPQQVGGGHVLKVEVLTSSQDLQKSLMNPDIDTYLIDHSSDSLLLILVSKSKPEHRIIEVNGSLVQSLTYLLSP